MHMPQRVSQHMYVQAVTDMSELFKGQHSFNEDISRWNTARCTTMRSMCPYLCTCVTVHMRDYARVCVHHSTTLRNDTSLSGLLAAIRSISRSPAGYENKRQRRPVSTPVCLSISKYACPLLSLSGRFDTCLCVPSRVNHGRQDVVRDNITSKITLDPVLTTECWFHLSFCPKIRHDGLFVHPSMRLCHPSIKVFQQTDGRTCCHKTRTHMPPRVRARACASAHIHDPRSHMKVSRENGHAGTRMSCKRMILLGQICGT